MKAFRAFCSVCRVTGGADHQSTERHRRALRPAVERHSMAWYRRHDLGGDRRVRRSAWWSPNTAEELGFEDETAIRDFMSLLDREPAEVAA